MGPSLGNQARQECTDVVLPWGHAGAGRRDATVCTHTHTHTQVSLALSAPPPVREEETLDSVQVYQPVALTRIRNNKDGVWGRRRAVPAADLKGCNAKRATCVRIASVVRTLGN